MRILALDLGNRTGWALYNDGVIISGVWEHHRTAQSRFEGGGMRFLRFSDHLSEVCGVKGVDRLVFEEVRSHKRPKQRSENVTAAQIYGGYLAVLTQFCEVQEPQIPYQGIPVGVLKKWATGKGNANKDLVIVRANEIMAPHEVEDDNEADAVILLHIAMETAGVL